ncbi:MAG: DUF2298 domain-containing protein, partial [Patescibacteria group bacterium]
MDWIASTLFWYIHLFFIGIIFMPFTKKLFPRFFDQGYAFSKTLGIICLTYATFLLGVIKVVPFTQTSLYVLLALFAAANLYVYIKDKDKGTFLALPMSRQIVFIFEEFLFLGAILLLAYIRGQEPSIHGLEKFMDFGFINAALKATHFPPLDMWYSAGPDLHGVDNPNGFPINYYYFGHLSGAVLIKLSSIPAYIGYNLILATIFAQGVTLAFSFVSNLIHLVQQNLSKKLLVPSVSTYLYGLL